MNLPAACSIRPPSSPPIGVFRPPGSKSLTNRALLLAALAPGCSTLRGCLESEDTILMRGALTRLGVGFKIADDATTIEVSGTGLPTHLDAPNEPLDVGTAGTAARFLTAILAASPVATRIDGTPRMRERPMAMLLDGLRELGGQITCTGNEGFVPLDIAPAEQGLRGGELRLGRPKSSQFISALLLAGPWMQQPLRIILEQGTPARPYIDMTLDILHRFGARASWLEGPVDTLSVEPGPLQSCDYTVEPDASAASYFLAMAAIYQGDATIEALGHTSVQGDTAFAPKVLRAMGARVEQTASQTRVVGTGRLQGGDFDLSDMPDMTLTLAALAAHAQGPTRVRGVAILRHHESDRLAAAATELRKLGAIVEEHEDGLDIQPPAQLKTGVA
ncbi:MAG: 3-phosphoshikimate 1-carboxyvinyltransferase, partial [Nannocystaceae bacterium]